MNIAVRPGELERYAALVRAGANSMASELCIILSALEIIARAPHAEPLRQEHFDSIGDAFTAAQNCTRVLNGLRAAFDSPRKAA
ncbi:MAG TPA: hypothetical protein VKV17_12805 [Bryobacteraceae bacterium]|nr:hypothetical protein [Bryobacteraceae bacterium]